MKIGHIVLMTILSLCLVSCSGDGAEDNRVCIVNDSFNVTPDNVADLEAEATSNNLDVQASNGQVAICGNSFDIDATVANGDDELISDFLGKGHYVS